MFFMCVIQSHLEIGFPQDHQRNGASQCHEHGVITYLCSTGEDRSKNRAAKIRGEMEYHHNQNAAAASIEKPGNHDLKCEAVDKEIKPGHMPVNKQW